MASYRRRVAGGLGFGLLGMLLGAPSASATDVGVAPDKLLIVQRATSKAKIVFKSKDAAITNGRAADLEGVRVRLQVQYGDGATVGAFMVPAGTSNGWVRNDPTMLRFYNPDAPSGATEVRSIVVRPHRLLKLTGAGLGDAPPDVTVARAPTGSVTCPLLLCRSWSCLAVKIIRPRSR